LPNENSDFHWLNQERERTTLFDYFNSDLQCNNISLSSLKKIYTHIQKEINENYIYRALKDAKQFFYDIKNYDGYNSCNILLDRLESNRISASLKNISKEDSSIEFANIRNSILNIIDSEIKSMIDSFEKFDKTETNRNSFQSASDFAMRNSQTIENIIVDNWKIPKTNYPGEFAETFNRVIKWFDNFKTSEFEYALMILRSLKFFSYNDVDEQLNKMSGELKNLFHNDFSTVGFFGLGISAGASGNQYLYSLKQKLSLKGINFPKDFNQLHPSIKSIVFIDDIIGTGNQASDLSNKYLRNISVNKIYYSLMAFESGLNKVKQSSPFDMVFTTKLLRESEKAFSDSTEIFTDISIRTKIKDMAINYGCILYPKGPLGYDDSQALIAFSHSTPNNTLPIIWASENNEKTIGVPWNPLWERRKVITHKTTI
jgi:hypothetical protein